MADSSHEPALKKRRTESNPSPTFSQQDNEENDIHHADVPDQTTDTVVVAEPERDGSDSSPPHEPETTDGPLESVEDAKSQSGSGDAQASQSHVYSNGDWQAVFDSDRQQYYFYNSTSGAKTWNNPFESKLQSPQDAGTTVPSIDPELAHLDPHSNLSGGPNSNYIPKASARFNARTGKFEGDPTFNPNRVSNAARARTQANAYFDVDGWEQSLESSNGRIQGTSKEVRAQEIRDGRRLNKDEVARFRQRRAEKKAERQRAWLKD